jgi:hypothetical protein
MAPRHDVWRRSLLVLCALAAVAASRTGPPPAPRATAVSTQPLSIRDGTTAALQGGRNPEHCALSVGIFLGGAMGFWVNPFLGVQAMRLGLMASVLHCS